MSSPKTPWTAFNDCSSVPCHLTLPSRCYCVANEAEDSMTDFDPSNPDPYKRMGWALRNYWWAIIPSVVGIVVLEELSQHRWGPNGKTMVQAGLLVFMLGALVYDRRVKRKKAEAERERQ